MSTTLALLEPLPQKLVVDRREFAALLGLSVGMVDKLIRGGQIKITRVGDRVLIPRRELLRFASEDSEQL